ncbi:MAG TPA: hypothetical protein VK433_05050 [Stellaceae bacterium]|nr:hypothetical protein [Stellaceae bacterium]
MQQAARAGQADLTLGRPHEAVDQYRRALQRAEMRDDLSEIVDYGYDLAIALLDDNRPEEALKTVRGINAELVRRNAQSPPSFTLIEAVALYRIGSRTDADRLAASIEYSSEPDIATRACFLRGLIADDRSDLAGLEEASRCLAAAGSAGSTDSQELSARISLERGDAKAAETAARDVADRRRESRDYRGMARALALAGAAASKSGSVAAAANYYLRAGRSAGAQGDVEHARQWIAAALSLSHDPELRSEAQRVLADLDKR